MGRDESRVRVDFSPLTLIILSKHLEMLKETVTFYVTLKNLVHVQLCLYGEKRTKRLMYSLHYKVPVRPCSFSLIDRLLIVPTVIYAGLCKVSTSCIAHPHFFHLN